ncbi:hypothetical protein AAHE18_15G104200 [Arachis hypogaea]
MRFAPVITRPGPHRNVSNGAVMEAYRSAPWMRHSNLLYVIDCLLFGFDGVPSQEARDCIIASPCKQVIRIRYLKWTHTNSCLIVVVFHLFQDRVIEEIPV